MIADKKIILINQQPDVLKVMQNLQLQVMEAKNCIEGIRKIIRFEPHLALVELDSLNLSGFSMARILQLLQLKIPLIFTSQSNKYRSKVKNYDNIIALVRHEDLSFSLENIILKGINNYQTIQSEYSYSFKQREWADLFSQSPRKRILIIVKQKELLKPTLQGLDKADTYELYSANDGLEGLLKALLIKPELILSDIQLPTIGGMTMSQIFFILDKPFPFVFFMSNENQKVLNKIKRIESVIGILPKKVLSDTPLLLNKISQFIEKSGIHGSQLIDSYQKGDMQTLLKSGKDEGVFALGNSK
ncbi:MAG: hypothetical protein GY786_11865 [Proteobacteria bacterium]|nr:hypothetical protein [Pseudomonadota bacterium]